MFFSIGFNEVLVVLVSFLMVVWCVVGLVECRLVVVCICCSMFLICGLFFLVSVFLISGIWVGLVFLSNLLVVVRCWLCCGESSFRFESVLLIVLCRWLLMVMFLVLLGVGLVWLVVGLNVLLVLLMMSMLLVGVM